MVIPWNDKRHYTIGIGIMLAIVLVLGVRSRATVNAVLSDKAPLAVSTSAPTRLITDELRGVTLRDEQVAAARLDETLEDPFLRDEKRTPKVVKAPPKVERLIQPRLAGLIFDDVSPTVQIRIGGERSDWLRPGDRFKGWKVADITSKSVKVKKGDREVVLK